MKHFIIGTAGHIDHGKTAIIKALTNIDCDTHPEEKRRGITINPGFAYLKKSEDDFLAFVDVPGHQKFIHNMIAGATGVDFIMLVISADDGVMPQTMEHLKICSLLGIRSGITVINKCDTVSPDFLELCRDEVCHFLKGTFLEHKPIFCVSALKGTGIEALRDYLFKGDFDVVAKERYDFFKMYVDRVFHVTGFGYIVTGTSLGSEVKVGDHLIVLPANKKVKVRNIQRHGESVPSCDPGSRLALDLAGIKRDDLEAGTMICEKELPKSDRVDVELVFIDEDYSTSVQFDALLLTGTKKLNIKVKIIHSYIKDNQKHSVAQLELGRSWYFSINEHFILRDTSNDITIAGGFVIDPIPLVHKKINKKLIDAILPVIGNTMEYMRYKVNETIYTLDTGFFSSVLQWKEEHIIDMIDNYDKLICIKHNYKNLLFSKQQFNEYSLLITEAIKNYYTHHPLSSSGVNREHIRSYLKEKRIYKDHISNELALNLFLNHMEKEGIITQSNNRWNIAGYKPTITKEQQENIHMVETIILAKGFEGIYEDELFEEYQKKASDNDLYRSIINRLTETKTIYKRDRLVYHANKISDAKTILYTFLPAHPEGIKVTQFRELLGANRKTAMTYLEILEEKEFIYREGDYRLLK